MHTLFVDLTDPRTMLALMTLLVNFSWLKDQVLAKGVSNVE